MRIYESTITNKGLDYIKSLDEFEIWGNHYFPYPKILDGLSNDHEINTEYHGNCEQGSAITTFKKKPSYQQELDKIKEAIELFEKLHGITITEWYKERDLDVKPF